MTTASLFKQIGSSLYCSFLGTCRLPQLEIAQSEMIVRQGNRYADRLLVE
jgi:hypothetical protein